MNCAEILRNEYGEDIWEILCDDGIFDANDFIRDYLEKHGYGGLCTDDCGCDIDDLHPCAGSCANCVPGYRQKDPEMIGESKP